MNCFWEDKNVTNPQMEWSQIINSLTRLHLLIFFSELLHHLVMF